MKPIIKLLQQRNNYLLEFSKISAIEHQRLQSGDYNGLNQFYDDRQTILEAVENIDKSLSQYKDQKISEKDKQEITKLLQEKRQLIWNILQKDILVHSYLNGLQGNKIVEDQIA